MSTLSHMLRPQRVHALSDRTYASRSCAERGRRGALRRALAVLLLTGACSAQSADPAQAPAATQAEPTAPSTETPTEPTSPTPACNIPECFRPVECVAKCGTAVLSSSCCACPEGQLDQLVECPPPHTPVCDPGCRAVCESGPCNCECDGVPESTQSSDTLGKSPTL